MSAARERTGGAPANAALWASAAVLAGLIMVQAARVNDAAALAGPAVKAESYSMVTVASLNTDVLVIADDRTETLSVYATRSNGKFEMMGIASLPELFTRGRREFRTAP